MRTEHSIPLVLLGIGMALALAWKLWEWTEPGRLVAGGNWF